MFSESFPVYRECVVADVRLEGVQHEIWLLLAAGIAGVASAVLVVILSTSGENPTTRILRCSMGFFVAIVWIMAIADEVVGVLRVGCLRYQLTPRVSKLLAPFVFTRRPDPYLDFQMPSWASPFFLSATHSRTWLRTRASR